MLSGVKDAGCLARLRLANCGQCGGGVLARPIVLARWACALGFCRHFAGTHHYVVGAVTRRRVNPELSRLKIPAYLDSLILSLANEPDVGGVVELDHRDWPFELRG